MNDKGEFEARNGAALSGPPQPAIVFGNTDVWFGPKVMNYIGAVLQTPSLEWFQSSAAGLEHPVLVSIGQKAELYTSSHAQAEAMAEWALWAALDFFRQGKARREDMAAQHWERRISREIATSHWLIYGFGSIGAAVGRRVRALGGTVTGVRRSGGVSEHADTIIKPDAMEGALGQADVVILCAPHTPETEGVANAGFFKAMREDALLLNLGRGALVVESDLIAALDAGDLAQATLDVVSEEPLPEGHPLWSHPKVLLTPHDSAGTTASRGRSDQVFLDNLKQWLDGAPLRNVVPPSTFSVS